MKRTFLLTLAIAAGFSQLTLTDRNNEIVELAKLYKNFMFRNAPPESAFKQLQNISSTELAVSVKFIRETISTNNNLTTPEFLTLPDEQTLKYLYTIRLVNWNLREDNPTDNNELINELMKKEVTRYELIDSYYDMLFSGVGNKNQPFDLSVTNFEMSGYGLKDDTEKAIFFFKAMDLCGTTIWGYMI